MSHDIPKQYSCPGQEHEYSHDIRLSSTLFPREYVRGKYPKFLNPSEVGIKGLIYSVKYLPRSRVWFAKGLISPVEVHPQLPLVAEMPPNIYIIKLPQHGPNAQAGVFSTGSLDTGKVETRRMLEKTNEDKGRANAEILVTVLERTLAIATTEIMDGIIEDRFDKRRPTHGITSRSRGDNPIPETLNIISTYDRLR